MSRRQSVLVMILLSCVHLSLSALNSETKSAAVPRDAVDGMQHQDEVLRRTKRQLGFWERYYEQYLHEENYLPAEVDILSIPRVFELLVHTLRRQGINYETIGEDVQRSLDEYMKEHYKAESLNYFKSFRPYREMMAFMRKALYRCRGRCSLFTIGQSYEGRPLTGIKIGTGKTKGDEKRRNIWIDAGIHPREWISHTTALYLADSLISGYTQDRFIRHMVDSYDWYILPCANPDGYSYTWMYNRLWRKTRRPIPGSKCYGVDLNRNFGFKWGTSGASSNPCRSNYRGDGPYTEPEARAIRDFIQSEARKDSWLMYITLHSKGQLVLSPWGYTAAKPAGFKKMEFVGRRIVKAMTDRHNMTYTFGSAAQILYRSSGTSRDWAHGEAGIPYVYTFELRDRNSRGWMLPPSHIIPAGEEVWAGIEASIKAIEELMPVANMAKRKSTKNANRVIKTSSR